MGAESPDEYSESVQRRLNQNRIVRGLRKDEQAMPKSSVANGRWRKSERIAYV